MKKILFACLLVLPFVAKSQITIFGDSAVYSDGTYVLRPHPVSNQHILCLLYDRKEGYLKKKYKMFSKKPFLNIVEFKNNEQNGNVIKDGEYLEFYPTTQIKRKINYSMGRENGKAYDYFPTGVTKKAWDYKNGVVSHTEEFSQTGILKKVSEYYPSGILNVETGYFSDNTEVEYYMPDGVKFRQTVTNYSKNTVKEQVYYANGRIKRELNFKNTQLSGTLKYWNIDSTQYREEEFVANKSVSVKCTDNGKVTECKQLIDTFKIDHSVKGFDAALKALLTRDGFSKISKDSLVWFSFLVDKENVVDSVVFARKPTTAVRNNVNEWLKNTNFTAEKLLGEPQKSYVEVVLMAGRDSMRMARNMQRRDFFVPDYTFTNTLNLVLPSFPGTKYALSQYIQKKLDYPSEAQKAGVSGKVFVGCTVAVDGRLLNIHIVNGVSSELDEEALRIVKGMPKWNPGREFNQPIAMEHIITVEFKIAK